MLDGTLHISVMRFLHSKKRFQHTSTQTIKQRFKILHTLPGWMNFLEMLSVAKQSIQPCGTLIKHLLTLSHGQGALERGYSINKDMLVENLKERSLVALRIVQDAVAEHPLDEVLPRGVILHCKGAWMRYMQYLEDETKKKIQTANERKRKDLRQEIANVNTKQQKIMHSIEVMQKEAD